MKVFGGRATQALTQDICSYLGIPPGQADIFKFPNDNTFVQNAVLSGAASERLSKAPLKELVVTDTVPVPPAKRWDNLVVLSIAPLLAECIRRIQGGQSVSALFM